MERGVEVPTAADTPEGSAPSGGRLVGLLFGAGRWRRPTLLSYFFRFAVLINCERDLSCSRRSRG